MRRFLLLLLLPILTSCSAAGDLLPSMRYCDEVDYKRHGTEVTLSAKCSAPVG